MTNEVAREYKEALDDRIMAGLSNIKEVMRKEGGRIRRNGR